MNFQIEDFFLEFKTPFKIAHGSRIGTDIVFLRFEHQGISSYGEASLPPYLPETKESVREFINAFFQSKSNNAEPVELLKMIHTYNGNTAAKACIDIALNNWLAARQGVSLHEFLSLDDHPSPYCTYTIAMDSEQIIKDKIEDAKDFRILKVKLGGDNDKNIIEIIRKYTDKPICVDANQGWKTRELALDMINFLTDKNTLLIEQPLPKENLEDQRWLFEKSTIPIYADESAQGPEDVSGLSKLFHGVNVKLMKCGGIIKAIEMIKNARKNNMGVMIGSMSETGCAIQAAAQISSLADYADLDGPLLTKNNPFNTVSYKSGKILIN